jgi:hypothetical protein
MARRRCMQRDGPNAGRFLLSRGADRQKTGCHSLCRSRFRLTTSEVGISSSECECGRSAVDAASRVVGGLQRLALIGCFPMHGSRKHRGG